MFQHRMSGAIKKSSCLQIILLIILQILEPSISYHYFFTQQMIVPSVCALFGGLGDLQLLGCKRNASVKYSLCLA